MVNKLLKAVITTNETIQLYRDLLDSYVSDFYIENHWDQKLSNSWKTFLSSLSFDQVAEILSYQRPLTTLAPLSILCLQEISRSFSVTRIQVPFIPSKPQDDLFNKHMWKNVKLKKRHEIEIMSRVCYEMGLKTDCFNLVDIGSGLGHLSRLLAYKYGYNICTFEANAVLTKAAQELDGKFAQILSSKNIAHCNKQKPIHFSKRIEETLSFEKFDRLVKEALCCNDSTKQNFKYGIVGLHPCGNLGSTLLKLFKDSPSVVFICMVSCCYMKLTTEPSEFCGFPLSTFYKSHEYKLDYLACEAACHAIENFTLNLKTSDCGHLKVHSYRAALESLIEKTDKSLRHCAINSVKYREGLTFKDYCLKALGKYDLTFSEEDYKLLEGVIERTWRDIVKFYSIRLFLTPLVESVILYDRLLYLKECSSSNYCDIIPAFDSSISARNHVLLSHKMKQC